MARILNGMWQTSGGWGKIEPGPALAAMDRLKTSGFTTFDFADHYGPAEDIYGAFVKRLGKTDEIQGFTKWCPSPAPMSAAVVSAAVAKSMKRMGVDSIDMMQFHWWDYSDKRWMDAMKQLNEERLAGRIKALSLTNFDSKHLRHMLVDMRLPIASNQVQHSVIDTRPQAGGMAKLCEEHGTVLLTYGTLMGGLLTDRWLGRKEPRVASDVPTPSLRKYYNMVRQWGSWDLFQEMLRTLKRVGDRRGGYTVAQVATKWVLDQPGVGGVVVGVRLGLSEHAEENAKTFQLELTKEDYDEIAAVQAKGENLLEAIGDCGDEYRG